MDISKFIMLNLRTNHLSPYFLKTDEWREHPLIQVRLMRVFGAWEVRLYDETTEEFAVLHVDGERDSNESLKAYAAFNALYEVQSRDQLESAGFIVYKVI